MSSPPKPRPLFDQIDYLHEPPSDELKKSLAILPTAHAWDEYLLTRQFLLSYDGSEDTFNAYRREVERLCHWSWLVAKKDLKALTRHDMLDFIKFAGQPPKSWVADQSHPRFQTQGEKRVPNRAWRPFLKRTQKQRSTNTTNPHTLSTSSIRALFASLSSFFEFLVQEQYISQNPVKMIRQKKQYLPSTQQLRVTRKLTQVQWRCIIETARDMAHQSPLYERHYFLIQVFYLLGLRISEVAPSERHIPTMGDFFPDEHSRWWFKTVGKGNKYREIAVPDTLLEGLIRYRQSLGLSDLPARGEATALVPKQKGQGGLGVRQIRNLIQQCFDAAMLRLKAAGKQYEADDLRSATVHWLRHTSISADVTHRPRDHVRDDAGHESSIITDRYIDSDREARHASAKDKPLIIEEDRG